MKKFNYAVLIMMFMFVFTIGNTFADTTVGTATRLVNDGQAQGQGQGQSIDDHSTNISEKAFPNQGGVGYGAMPGYFGDNNKPGHQFISLNKLMMYTTSWNVEDAKAMIEGNSSKINLILAPLVKKVDSKEATTTIICTKKAFDTDKFIVTQLGFGTVNAKNKNGISAFALAKALIKASEYGATHIQFLGEGTNTELSSGGWGIGLAYTKASDTSVSTGGTGFSTGWAGYNNLPWQQFIILKVVDPAAVAATEVEEEKTVVVESSEIIDENVDKSVKSEVTQ